MSRRTRIHLVMWTIVVLVTLDVLLDGPLRALDWQVHGWLNDHSTGAFRVTAFVLAQAGQRIAVVATLGIAAVVLAIRYRTIRPLVLAGSVCLALALIVPAIKLGIGRTAPREGVDMLYAYGRHAAEYPSGHAINGIVLWGMTLEYLAMLGGRWARVLTVRRRRWLTACTGFAAGAGMLGLNYHWLTDVLAGWPMGVSFLLIALGIPIVRPATLKARQVPDRSGPSE